jgi:hypothetical protein
MLQRLAGDLALPRPKPRIARSADDDPARAACVDLVLRDPAAARRARLDQRLAYWRTLVARRRQALDEARARLKRLQRAPGRTLARQAVQRCEAELRAAERALAAVAAEAQ